MNYLTLGAVGILSVVLLITIVYVTNEARIYQEDITFAENITGNSSAYIPLAHTPLTGTLTFYNTSETTQYLNITVIT